MPKRIGHNAEEYLKKQKQAHLKHLIESYGIKVKLLGVSSGTYNKVYGTDTGVNQKMAPIAEIDCLITSDDFFPTSSSASGGFIEGWLYTNSDKIQVGQIVQVTSSDDGKSRQYRVEGVWARGMTIDVFKRYKIVAMGG
jgi:ribosomal protein S8E